MIDFLYQKINLNYQFYLTIIIIIISRYFIFFIIILFYYLKFNFNFFFKIKIDLLPCESNFKAVNQIRALQKSNYLDDTGIFESTCRYGIPLKFLNLKNMEER